MTEVQYAQASYLLQVIGNLKGSLAVLEDMPNNLRLEPEMWHRKIAKQRADLERELNLREAEFSDL